MNAEVTREERYHTATKLFGSKTSAAWDEIKTELAAKAPSGVACYYCERDRFRDIDHVQPKRHYPERAFDWTNYVYACVICNQDHKKDTYGVIDLNGTLIEFDRSLSFLSPLPIGIPALIDVRNEDPLDFFRLELGTGSLTISATGTDYVRAYFTRKLFELDDADMQRQRRCALVAFRDYLLRYLEAAINGDAGRLARINDEIAKLAHPTVLIEMRRQSNSYPDLANLFANLPPEIGAYI